ncbi:hypothetical protein OEG84_00905 [Hoeflea sp. G2-23]|uniref:Succinoglycan biosynthesis protein exoi n=1 Tax=Hoeflea algicola TaxID=2983763 RepID=A0ABT3Z3U2_9HYPH|nr:hypothetical protein [Hoeflea algicola]MCY0146313.1 hypothetical protein [Hoeflea algicola]
MPRFATLVIVCSAAAFIAPSAISRIGVSFSDELSELTKQCLIKGNVSINTGERIYHVPGQEFYTPTKISARYGERWFCSEAEARAAGWRKARR